MNRNPSLENEKEKRKYIRAKFREPVLIHNVVESKSQNIFEVQGDPVVVRAEDLSEGGIRLKVGNLTSPIKIFKINFQIQKNRMVDVYSKLAWVGTNGMFGLQFILVSHEDRRLILGFLEKGTRIYFQNY